MPNRLKPLLALFLPQSREAKPSIMTGVGDFTCVFVVDPNFELVEVNKVAVDLLGEGNLIGKKIWDLFFWGGTRKRKALFRAHLGKAMQGETVQYEMRTRFKTSPHKVIYVDVSLTPLSGATDSSSVDSIVVTARNVTDQKQYQNELARTYSSYNKLIGANVIGMFVVDRQGELSDINTAFVTLIGHSPESFTAKDLNWYKLFRQSEFEEVTDDLQTMIQNSALDPVERELENVEGESVPVILTGVRINNHPDQFLCMVIDISERKHLEQQKDEFMSIASHELKTPLTSLKGYVQLLQLYLQQGKTNETQGFIGKINGQVEKMITLVEDLLNSSRLDLGKMSYTFSLFDMQDFIAEKVAEAKAMYPDAQFDLDTNRRHAPVMADKMRIEQVFLNLISNAIKYAPNNHHITVRVKVNEDQVIVEVEDRGMGIPVDRIPFLFDKYYREVNPKLRFTEGLGLGLYISAQILKQHRGQINAISELNKGSIFYFTLPLHRD